MFSSSRETAPVEVIRSASSVHPSIGAATRPVVSRMCVRLSPIVSWNSLLSSRGGNSRGTGPRNRCWSLVVDFGLDIQRERRLYPFSVEKMQLLIPAQVVVRDGLQELRALDVQMLIYPDEELDIVLLGHLFFVARPRCSRAGLRRGWRLKYSRPRRIDKRGTLSRSRCPYGRPSSVAPNHLGHSPASPGFLSTS